MHKGMEGKHLFDVKLVTNDPAQLEKHLYIGSDWEAPGS